jgi:hypothetical protein
MVSDQDAAYMAEALAEGKHMTERGVNDMIYVEPERLVPLGSPESFTNYIEILESALLEAWPAPPARLWRFCRHCRGTGFPLTHTPCCIVPYLIAKYDE